MNFAFLITCHNRREKTLECIRRIYELDTNSIDNYTFQIILVDDGSIDGTYESVSNEYPKVKIIKGDGNLFWGGGMCLAMNEAMKLKEEVDYYIWLNDDTMLYGDALDILYMDYITAVALSKSYVVVSGATQDPESGEVTYGGFIQSCRQHCTGDIIELDEINGNFVIIPKEIVDVVGNIDSVFRHSLGDIDYGKRVIANGFKLFLTSQYIGSCQGNSLANTWMDPKVPIVKRYKKLVSPKGVPPKQLFVMCRRYDGRLWLLKWIQPFVVILYTSVIYKCKSIFGRERKH